MYQIPEWSSFQSYKDRCPPWIRLHRRLLDNFKYQKMSAEARALLPMLWLLAAEDENPVTGSLRIRNEEIAFRLRRPEKDIAAAISEIIRNGFLVDLNPEESTSYESVTESLRNCHSETEAETKTKTEKEKNIKKRKVEKPPDVSDQVWSDFLTHRQAKRAPVTQTVLKTIRAEADKAGWPVEQALAEMTNRGWQGFKASWTAEKKGGNQYDQPKSKGNAREELAECLDSLRRGKSDDGPDVLLWKSEHL